MTTATNPKRKMTDTTDTTKTPTYSDDFERLSEAYADRRAEAPEEHPFYVGLRLKREALAARDAERAARNTPLMLAAWKAMNYELRGHLRPRKPPKELPRPSGFYLPAPKPRKAKRKVDARTQAWRDLNKKLRVVPATTAVTQGAAAFLADLNVELRPLVDRGLSLRAICDELQALGVRTRRGGKYWEPGTVRRYLRRNPWMWNRYRVRVGLPVAASKPALTADQVASGIRGRALAATGITGTDLGRHESRHEELTRRATRKSNRATQAQRETRRLAPRRAIYGEHLSHQGLAVLAERAKACKPGVWWRTKSPDYRAGLVKFRCATHPVQDLPAK